jgi:hypothetical protein
MFTELIDKEYPKLIGDAIGTYSAQYAHKLYELECGHRQDIKKQHAAAGKFRCKTCLIDKYENIAKLNNLEIVNHTPNSDPDYKLYKFKDCGHEKLFASYNIKSGISCSTCTIQSRFDAAHRNNLELLNADCTDKWMHRDYKYKKCSHIQSMKIQDVGNNNIPECRECRQNSWIEDALSVGLVFIGESKNKVHKNSKYYEYLLPCGCKKDFLIGSIKKNSWACDVHSNFWNKRSNVYLIKFTELSSGFSWLKVGVSTNVNRRINDYKLKSKCLHDILYVKEFDTYKEALVFEKNIHCKYKNINLDHNTMKKFKQNGWSECYPVEFSCDFVSIIRDKEE